MVEIGGIDQSPRALPDVLLRTVQARSLEVSSRVRAGTSIEDERSEATIDGNKDAVPVIGRGAGND